MLVNTLKALIKSLQFVIYDLSKVRQVLLVVYASRDIALYLYDDMDDIILIVKHVGYAQIYLLNYINMFK